MFQVLCNKVFSIRDSSIKGKMLVLEVQVLSIKKQSVKY